MSQTVVKRTVGFTREFEFVGETTTAGRDGTPVTARAFGHTPSGAAQRSQLEARDRAMFAGMKRVCGFVKDTVFRTANQPADYAPGFFARERNTETRRASFRVGFA